MRIMTLGQLRMIFVFLIWLRMLMLAVTVLVSLIFLMRARSILLEPCVPWLDGEPLQREAVLLASR